MLYPLVERGQGVTLFHTYAMAMLDVALIVFAVGAVGALGLLYLIERG